MNKSEFILSNINERQYGLIVVSKPMKTDQEKYNVIDILRRSGINASSGSRNSETDILVDKFDTDKAINILSAAGIKSSMG